MYAGGQDYFAALGDPRFAAQGGSSCFALANEHWQFLGLDTSYEDAGLHGDQAAWVAAQRAEHPDAAPRCSATTSCSAPTRRARGRCGRRSGRSSPARRSTPGSGGTSTAASSTATSRTSRFASCAGHGGIPEYLVEQHAVPPDGLVYEYRKQYGTGWQPWNTFGFAVLDVDGPRIDLRYIDEDGNEHYRTALP